MNNSSRFDPLYRLALIVPSVAALAGFFYVAFSRVGYPFALEWMESGTYLHVKQVLAGKPLYAAPGYDFIAMMYPPLTYYVAAPLAALTNNILFSMRLVSIGSSLAAFALLYGVCRARQLPHSVSFLAVGFAAAAYKATGFWFDIGRVDMLFLALLLLAYLLVTIGPGREVFMGIAAGGALLLAFTAKQQALVAYPFLVASLLLEHRQKKAVAFGVSAALLMGIFAVAFNVASHGWFQFYLLTLPMSAPSPLAGFAETWRLLLAPSFWPLIVLIVLGAAVALASRRSSQNVPRLISLSLLLLPLLIMSYLTLAKQWGYINGFLPAAFGLALAGAEAISYAMETPVAPRWAKAGLLAVTLALVWLQFGVSRYDPRDQIPSAASVAAGYQALDRISQAPTPIFAPTAAYLLDMVGQPMHYQASALSDIALAARSNPKVEEILSRYQADISGRYRNGNAAAAVLAEPNWYAAIFSPENGYTCESLTSDGATLATLTGAKHALGQLCVLH